MSIFDYVVKDAEGNDVSLEIYRGKTLLIVNTATGCGFTPQYEGLERLYRKYKEQGLMILDFPCNQFGNQAPGTEAEIKNFCQLKYDTSFPLFAKVKVNGTGAEPLFQYLKAEKSGLIGNKIKWNFTKFLVDKEGQVIERFGPNITPDKIEGHIKKIL